MKLRHGRKNLELRELRAEPGPRLLLLHALYGSSRDWTHERFAWLHSGTWPGAVFALDFAGHGASEPLTGGAYAPELFAADADVALAEIGAAALVGSGIGAYAALLLAGARPQSATPVLLLPGAGLDGGGEVPALVGDSAAPGTAQPAAALPEGCDPDVHCCAVDIRPRDYARAFADGAGRILQLEDGTQRPPWWEAVRESASAEPVMGGVRRAFEILAE